MSTNGLRSIQRKVGASRSKRFPLNPTLSCSYYFSNVPIWFIDELKTQNTVKTILLSVLAQNIYGAQEQIVADNFTNENDLTYTWRAREGVSSRA